jgi:hypothetical protein
MRRAGGLSLLSLLALLVPAPLAGAATPTLGPVSATNLQGVSALLVGSVDPGGEPTTYRYDYTTQADFAAHGFTAATATPAATVGSGSTAHPARAAISGLSPSTAYRFRLVAANASGTAAAEATFTTTAGFGFLPGEEGFAARVYADGGVAATQAGSHPYQLELSFALREGGEFEGQPGVAFPDGDLRGLELQMPPGLLANPAAAPTCSLADFHTPRDSPFEVSRSGESCPDRTQVGTVEIRSASGGGATRRFGLFNLDPAPGVPAQLGFAPYGHPVALDTILRPGTDNSYTLALTARNFPQALDLTGLSLSLWGIPWNPSHDGERGDCLNEAEPDFPWAKCSLGPPSDPDSTPVAYLTLPKRCKGPLSFAVTASAWQQPARVGAGALNRNGNGGVAEMGFCESLSFDPEPFALLTDAKASSPSGFNFRLREENPALTLPQQLVPPEARKATVLLPEGVSVNPSVGAGLEACAPGQYAAESAFSPPGAGCPNGSKIGDFSVRSPLFDEWIEGAIYLARPHDNPFDTLVAVYLVAKLPQRGILVKLAGRIDPDPRTGRLTATFDGLPQIPYTELDVNFRTGQRAFLVTPPACGPADTRTELTPWSGNRAAGATTSSPIETGIDGGPCPTGGVPPFAPGAVAGGVNSNVGSYTPYFVRLTRKDTEQEITSYSLVLPKGITGKLAGIPFCPEAAIAAARTRQGVAEARDPSCPEASQVGRTISGYGVGHTLTYASGRIYLAGPYHGSPLSLVTINPATVGPFDLGTVVIRSAFDIDPRTAQLQIDSRASDPIPHIIDGIPLHLREVRIHIDRSNFTHNPSSCEASQLVSTLTGSGARFDEVGDDSTATVTKRFQLLNCLTLGFKPKLGLRLRGGVRRGSYPELRATFATRGPQDSNLKQIAVSIPHQMFLAQEHIRGICTRPAFEAERCPANSAYGHAVAYTPLFDTPLRGEVYLRSSVHRLPDLVASLHSGAIRIILEGRIGPSRKGGIRAYFSELPDAPIERFTMTLDGGKRGLLVNSANVCATPPVATVKALGQNNLGSTFTTLLRGRCGGKGKADGKKRNQGGRG